MYSANSALAFAADTVVATGSTSQQVILTILTSRDAVNLAPKWSGTPDEPAVVQDCRQHAA
jgi:hypothetical protein